MNDMATIPAATGTRTFSQVLGEIVWLMSQSPTHRQLFVSDLEWFCMPPLLLEQFRVFYGPEMPSAVAMWASVSDDVEQRLLAGGQKLKPDEWNSGQRLWVMELVAPFGGQDHVLADLSAQVFGGRSFKLHKTLPDGRRTVGEYPPPS